MTHADEPHVLIDAYYDDALDDGVRAAFETHLVGCARCQARLDELMALDAVTAEVRAQEAKAGAGAGAGAGATPAASPGALVDDSPGAPVVSLDAHRRRRARPLVAGGLVVAFAAAAAVLLVGRCDRPPTPGAPPPVALALASERELEPRLTYGPAAAHRPYGPRRGGAAGGEPGPRAAVAELERRGDARGVAAAWLLGGASERALAALAELRGPEADSDRAAILLVLGRGDDALVAADAALAAMPELAAARWNRALALVALGLPGAAAAEWRRVAAAGEPGWSDEARARASVLERELAKLRGRAQALEVFARACVAGAPGDSAVLDDVPLPAARRALVACAAALPTPAARRALAPIAGRVDARAAAAAAPLAPSLAAGRVPDAGADAACTTPEPGSACQGLDLVRGRLALSRGDAATALTHARAALAAARTAGLTADERAALSLWLEAATALGLTASARAASAELL